MHCYPARIIHDDRMKTLRDDAAEARLAAEFRRDRNRLPVASVPGWLRQALDRTSGWARRDALAHSLRGGLRPASDPQLAEVA